MNCNEASARLNAAQVARRHPVPVAVPAPAVPETAREAARRLSAAKIAEGYQPVGLHEYQDADGQPIYWRIRLKHPNGKKWLRPMRRIGDDFEVGEPDFPNGKPLYHLPLIAKADPADIVFIVEGEACADLLVKRGLIATTSGSSSSAEAADWTPLRGRQCVVWPDHDQPGSQYADHVVARLRDVQADVQVIDKTIVEALPEHADVVNWIAQHPDATTDDIRKLPTTAPAPVETAAPRPLPDPLPAVPAFNPALLPDSIRAWCEEAAEGLQVPLDFTAIPAMVALAGAVGRKVGISMKRNQHWIEHAVLWGAAIGRPSTSKSPAMQPARRMLERLEKIEHKDFEVRLKEYQANAMVGDGEEHNGKAAIRKALKEGNKQAANKIARDIIDADADAPTEPRIVVNDGTVEKIGELLNENADGLLQFRDELTGWLASLDKEGREGDRGFWLECFNGTGAYTVDRIVRGTIRIEACAVSILGGIQPGKLAAYVRQAVNGGFGDDGLIQRFQLAVYPDVPASWRYSDRPVDADIEATAFEVFKRLRNLKADDVGAVSEPWADVPFLRFDDEAQELFVEWFTTHMTTLRAGNEPPWLESHLGKYQGLVGRLALILHLADGHKGAVAADTLAKALDWIEYLTGHARRIYAPATTADIGAAHLILKHRADLPDGFTARDLYRRCWAGLNDPDIVVDGIDLLVEYHYLIEIQAVTGGRPSATYAWRPSP